MPAFPAAAAAAAAEICLAMMLLLALLVAASSAAAADAINTTTWSSSCEPAKCGELTIGYPFWLEGTHPPECGYRAFQVSCQQRLASLKNGFWTYEIKNISYERSSFRVSNVQLSQDSCSLESNFNASADLSFGPFNISSENQELFFIYKCTQSRRQLPSSWASIHCPFDSGDSYAWLAREYKPDDALKPLPGNCTVSMLPVLGYAGATAKDYERLIKGGFLLEYPMTPDDCKYCSETGGRCRVNATYDELECQCPDGLSPVLFCGALVLRWPLFSHRTDSFNMQSCPNPFQPSLDAADAPDAGR
ncbi:hypothetical protein GUJ93_ZPchr0001g29447 [Zizania palustris]|uniref:Wall-associated receptor kinase galacturonan-binding domain-containing protein n=1 Tax=Zizania palustris TaxID=103762 RepID=A0A8J5RNT9_ZIZPA|nr:hypothetical protein GUJ93_ZPchr0001g29447 [Zizania palustris]